MIQEGKELISFKQTSGSLIQGHPQVSIPGLLHLGQQVFTLDNGSLARKEGDGKAPN